jgi:hypothetical protein
VAVVMASTAHHHATRALPEQRHLPCGIAAAVPAVPDELEDSRCDLDRDRTNALGPPCRLTVLGDHWTPSQPVCVEVDPRHMELSGLREPAAALTCGNISGAAELETSPSGPPIRP